ncbi:MAG: type II toxin-antitoxin system RelB/DinJ family antitoxin, partial [Synergistaceae bacterium]|nr:type II toxin-antitoxin system RelB/DinJ family antitoxin [Synergistaceae bacterium]
DADLKERAEVVFEELGTSTSRIVNLLLNHVAVLKKIPENLGVPPVPCVDDMTEDEFDAMIDEAMESVKSGRTVSAEELREEMSEQYGFNF